MSLESQLSDQIADKINQMVHLHQRGAHKIHVNSVIGDLREIQATIDAYVDERIEGLQSNYERAQ